MCDGGVEIVGLLKIGLVYYVFVMLVIEMVDVYLKDKRCFFLCVVNLNGEYGLIDMYVGVFVILGVNGVEKVVEVEFIFEEKVMFDYFVEVVKGLFDVCKNLELVLV